MGGRLIIGRVLQLDAMKNVYAGPEVKQSADKGTCDKRVFVIPELINDFVDKFRRDTKLHCMSLTAYFWIFICVTYRTALRCNCLDQIFDARRRRAGRQHGHYSGN